MTLLTSDFDYDLPPERIAQTPLEPRDSSRLLVLHRDTSALEHRRFTDVLDYLRPNDLLVLNDTRVLPARLRGRREDTGGRVELLLLERLAPGLWKALGKPGRSLRAGGRLRFEGGGATVRVEVVGVEDEGVRVVRVDDESALASVGSVPLPPYIHQALADPERYQTVYAREPGAVAAPTAGLHFTPGLLERVKASGIGVAFVTLHVGLDTFRPVTEESPLDHKLHTEWYALPAETARAINAARSRGGRVVAVGTTSVRVLEQAGRDMAARGEASVTAATGRADIFIVPGHVFRLVDVMITNFHLPRSTLLMLVSAFAGRERVLAAYREAMAQGYRFYSLGDAMLVV